VSFGATLEKHLTESSLSQRRHAGACPGLSRASTLLALRGQKDVDGRDKARPWRESTHLRAQANLELWRHCRLAYVV